MNRTLSHGVFCAFSLLLFLHSGIEYVQADIFSFNFTGRVTETSGTTFGAVANVNDPLTGSFTIDTDAAVTNTLPGAGGAGSTVVYNQTVAAAKFSVTVDGVVFESDGVLQTSVANDFAFFAGAPPIDFFVIGDGVETGLANTTGDTILVDGSQQLGRVSLQLSDDTASAFGSTSLPSSFALSDFDQIQGRINGTDSQGQFGSLTYQLDSLTATAVPEPSASLLLASLVAALSVLRRRRSSLLIA